MMMEEESYNAVPPLIVIVAQGNEDGSFHTGEDEPTRGCGSNAPPPPEFGLDPLEIERVDPLVVHVIESTSPQEKLEEREQESDEMFPSPSAIYGTNVCRLVLVLVFLLMFCLARGFDIDMQKLYRDVYLQAGLLLGVSTVFWLLVRISVPFLSGRDGGYSCCTLMNDQPLETIALACQ